MCCSPVITEMHGFCKMLCILVQRKSKDFCKDKAVPDIQGDIKKFVDWSDKVTGSQNEQILIKLEGCVLLC